MNVFEILCISNTQGDSQTTRPTFDWTVLSLWMERGGGSQTTLSDFPFHSSAGTLDMPH